MSKTLAENLKRSDKAKAFDEHLRTLIWLQRQISRHIKEEGQQLGGISF